MSLVRFGQDGSDVYIFESASGLECCGCNLCGGVSLTVATAQEMAAHVAKHRSREQHVPAFVDDALRTRAGAADVAAAELRGAENALRKAAAATMPADTDPECRAAISRWLLGRADRIANGER